MNLPKHIDVFSCPKRLVYLGKQIESLEDQETRTPFENLEQKENRNIINKALELLSTREREVLLTRLGFTTFTTDNPVTYRDLGKKFGVCGERVRAIEQEALRKLRHPKFLRLFAKNLDLSGLFNSNKKTVSWAQDYVMTLIKSDLI